MRRLLLSVICLLVLGTVFAATEITLWTAPNPQQETFWKNMLDEWKKINPDIKVNWSVIPATGSSEEAILTSIAAGKGPDICTNIFSGFAAQLIEAEQLVPLNTFSDFNELLEARKMTEAIKGWESGGNHYVIPIYSNPMIFWWRKDLLEEAGFENPPRTYSEVYDLAEKLSIPKERYGILFIKGRNWWDRWFDFITFYYAASDGAPYIDTNRNRILINNEYGIKVAEFIYTLFEKEYTAIDLMDNPLYTGAIAGELQGPWEIPRALTVFPDIYPDKIVMSSIPVPDDYPPDKPVKTFADTKGMVMFKSTKNREAAWEFIKWVFSSVDHDKLWLELTNLPPVRADLTTNEAFADIMEANPGLAMYANEVPNAVPPALTPRTIEVQDSMSQYLTEPISLLKGNFKEILENAVKAINRELF